MSRPEGWLGAGRPGAGRPGSIWVAGPLGRGDGLALLWACLMGLAEVNGCHTSRLTCARPWPRAGQEVTGQSSFPWEAHSLGAQAGRSRSHDHVETLSLAGLAAVGARRSCVL